MSRRSKKSGSGHTSDDFEDDLQSMLAAEQAIPRRLHAASPPKATSFNDLRRWAPDRLDDYQEPVREATGRPARIVHKVATRNAIGRRGKASALRNTHVLFSKTLSDRPYFGSPTTTSLCVKRRQRRESLFALRRTGKGARTPKRRNKWSSISC